MTTARDTIGQVKAEHYEGVGLGADFCAGHHGDYWPCPEARLVAFTEAILDRSETYGALGRNIMLDPLAAAIYRDVANEITALADQHLGSPQP